MRKAKLNLLRILFISKFVEFYQVKLERTVIFIESIGSVVH